MSNSVIKVTEPPINDSLILVVAEDGTVTPDKATVEAYLNSRSGETELQIMHVNKSDGKNMDVTVNTLTYLATHEEGTYSKMQDTDEISRNLQSFRMDHDYTRLTSPRPPSPVHEVMDALAHELSILDAVNTEQLVTRVVAPIKVVKPLPKPPPPPPPPKRIPPLITQQTIKNKIIKPTTPIFKQPVKTPTKTKAIIKPKPVEEEEEEQEEEEESYSDEDFTMESEESEDDANDSDFDIDELTRIKPTKKIPRTRGTRVSESLDTQKTPPKPAKTIKTFPPKLSVITKPEPEPPKVEPDKLDKKSIPKKEKKTPKPIPDDFALFSTPDIIRRVGGKQESVTTPTTPNTPESPKSLKPARIFPDSPIKSQQRSSLESKEKRLSTDIKLESPKQVVQQQQQQHRLSLGSENKNKDRRHSLDVKVRRQSIDMKTDFRINMEKTLDIKKLQASAIDANTSKSDSHIGGHGMEEPAAGNSNESVTTNHLGPIPSAEDIRAIIQNEDTKTFTSNLIIPEPEPGESNMDPSHLNLETAALDLDQSILDNINSDLISEDILYQVAQSLVDNAELQNAIDKSLVDGNLVLDPSLQHAVTHDHHGTPIQQSHTILNDQTSQELSTPTLKGTQIVRSGGRVVVIPPPERPTTRSRNKKQQQEVEIPKPTKLPSRLLDDEHVSGAELDSSSDDDKSDDDPDKLWCICNQPHNNRFMICCDTCEEWYHGKCVNVTKAMGQMMEQEGKEWICLYCRDGSLKRPAAAARRVRKASRTSSTENISMDRKSDFGVTSPLGSPTSVPGCLVCTKPCRTNSIYCSDPCILKHAKVVEKVVVFERSSGKILSGNNAPSAADLDKWLQDHPGFEVVRSTNAKKPVTTTTTKPLAQSKLKIVKNPPNQGGVSLAVQRKGVNVSILRHSPKTQQQVTATPPKTTKQNITGFKIISKQVVTTPRTKLIQPAPLVRNPGAITSSKIPKVAPPTPPVKAIPTPTPPKDKPMPQKTPKSRQVEEMAPQPKKEENIRDNVQKTLLEQLTNRLKLIDDIKLTKEQVTKISTDIELQLYRCFGDTGQKYRNKYRSLIFNIKDIKNQTLWRRICEKSISPYQLVRLSPDDMASQELASWRERENKHQLEMITKSELEQLGRNVQYVFKTHKGEQELEENRPSDRVDNTEVITALGADSSGASPESSTDAKKDSKNKEKKTSKHGRSDRDRNISRKSSKEKDKLTRKDRKRERRSSSRERSRRKKSRSKEKDANHHSDKNRSRSRDRDRHRRSSHKSSRHKKDVHSTTEKLDKKSKEILEQLVDNKIVPPLEDRLWKHVQQEDITTVPTAESDSDHEPTSTVTIPTPPRIGDTEEHQLTPLSSNDLSEIKEDKQDEESLLNDVPQLNESMDEDGSRSPPPRIHAEFIWKGIINMVDVAQISITAHEVSGDCSGLGEELPPCLDVVGRISPDTVWDYISKMKCSNSKAISLLRLNATNVEEKMPYIALYSYLSNRQRLGVVKSNNKAVKDFYILPLASQIPIPQALLPLNGPGFEESRPALLLGILVRDKRKRPLFTTTPVATKRSKLDIPPLPTTPVTTPVTSGRSYTPPPNSDPRVKPPPTSLPKVNLNSPKEEPVEDMDEPYSPEDSDPDTAPVVVADSSSKSSSHLNATDLSNLVTGSVQASSFLKTGLTIQTFEPFANKFNAIPGLDESVDAVIPSNSEDIKRKMEELDKCIAEQKAEIDNMSQNIASTSSSNLGTQALASIALPSNLQQILDSIKGINATPGSEAETLQMIKQESLKATSESDLTIPLILPKISARSHAAPSAISSPTIPLNLPKYKSKLGSSPTPQQTVNKIIPPPQKQGDSGGTSVLSSLSEEDLIRKAAEMLGETEDSVGADSLSFIAPLNIALPSSSTPISVGTSKSAKLDVSQPPIPGLED